MKLLEINNTTQSKIRIHRPWAHQSRKTWALVAIYFTVSQLVKILRTAY